MGFFPDDEGPATIEPLSSDNASQAVMAGVISRSAYVEAHAPPDKDKGQCHFFSPGHQILWSVPRILRSLLETCSYHSRHRHDIVNKQIFRTQLLVKKLIQYTVLKCLSSNKDGSIFKSRCMDLLMYVGKDKYVRYRTKVTY